MKSILDCRMGLYEKALPSYLTWEEKLSKAKEAGYDFLEISIDETAEKMNRLQWSEEEMQQILQAIQSTGIPILTMCLSGNRKYAIGSEDSNSREKGIKLIKDAILFSVKVGIRIVQLASYDNYYGERNLNTQKYFLESLKEVTQFAEAHAVMLAFENMDTDFIDTISKAMQYVEIVNSPWLQVYPDIGNLVGVGYTKELIESDISNGVNHITAIHLKDARLGEIRNVPYGKGNVEFSEFFSFLEQINYRGLFVAEMWSDESEESIEYVKYARHFLEEKMSEAIYHRKILR